MIDPVVRLEEANLKYVPWCGPGWYWVDPVERRGGLPGPVRVTGPYADAAVALSEYYAYCACMTI